jgi:hypothetical protein
MMFMETRLWMKYQPDRQCYKSFAHLENRCNIKKQIINFKEYALKKCNGVCQVCIPAFCLVNIACKLQQNKLKTKKKLRMCVILMFFY